MSFKVKALNPDSDIEINQLCSLYSRSYGPKFTVTPVDASRFWKSRVGNRFTTLVVTENSKFIASVSLRPDRDNPSHIQFYLPVCDPSYLARATEVRAAMADLLHRLSLRQNWEMVYSHQLLQIPEQAEFSHFLVDGVDVAFWPASLPSVSKHSSKNDASVESASLGSVLISQRVLETPTAQKDKNIVLFSPTHHLQFCRWVYQSLGLSFSITDNLKEASRQVISIHNSAAGNKFSPESRSQKELGSSSILALSADRRAIERQAHRQAGFSICFVEPSLASSFRDLEQVLSKKARSADYVALNMLDPKTPQFAEELEERGFGLGGVLPYHRNRHTLLYYRTATEFNWKSLSQNSDLFDYLRTNDSGTLLSANGRANKKSVAGNSRSLT